MAVKISELPAAGSAAGTDQLEANQGGTSRRLTVAQVATHVRSTATDTVVVAAGSAAAPSIAPTGDSNTGIFFPAADTIAFSEGGVEALRLDSSGNATFAGTAAMASSFLRNRIINGDMRIDQRNAGASFSSGVGAITYGLDRFYVFSSGAAVTGQRVNPSLTGFPNALRVTGGGGVTYTEVGQRIESVNIADLAGSTVTISFWAAASVATSILVYTAYANSQDSFGTTTGIGSSGVSITSALTRYTVSVSLPAQATNGIVLGFVLSPGSGLTSGTFTLTGVQLEVGSVATPFERRQFGQELALCQRYYSEVAVTPTATSIFSYTFLPATMRAAPTISLKNGSFNGATYGVAPYGTASIRQNANSAGATDALAACSAEL